MRKRTKHENTQSPSFSYDTKMAADVNTSAQSINTERAENTVRGLVYKHVCACIHLKQIPLFLANALKHALSSEVDRLEELIDKLESKVM